MELKPQTTLEYYLDAILHNLQNDGFVREVPKPPRTRLECFLYHLNEKAKDIGVNYTELEYLESTGAQYIDTGFNVNKNNFLNIRFVVEEEFLQSNFWSVNGMSNNPVNFFHCGVGLKNYYSYAVGRDENTIAKYTGNKSRCDLNVPNNSYTVTDMITNKIVVDTPLNIFDTYTDEGGSLWLFGYNLIKRLHSGRIYSSKIYENGKIKRDFIPVIYNGDTPCMYDKVEQKFYFNQGTGQFIAGYKKIEIDWVGVELE